MSNSRQRPADANPDDLYEDLTPEEWNELYAIQTHFMNFKGIAAGCKNWEEVINLLERRIHEIEALKDQGAQILDNCEGLILYHVPEHFGAYATYLGKEDDSYIIRLHTSETVNIPFDPQCNRLAETPFGSRLVVLLNSKNEILEFMVSEYQKKSKARVKKRGDSVA